MKLYTKQRRLLRTNKEISELEKLKVYLTIQKKFGIPIKVRYLKVAALD